MSSQPISLNPQQVQQFADEGWTKLGRVLDDGLIAAMRAEEARVREFEPYEPGVTIFRSQMARYSSVVREVIGAAPLVSIACQLVGPTVCHWYNQFVTKMPDGSRNKSEFPWHQDNGYISVEPATNITIWIALDDVDERNGCVWVMPHSHEKGLLEHRTKGPDSWHMTVDVEGDGVPAILKAGEAVAFSALTLHRSKFNLTDSPRRAFFVEYADPAGVFSNPADPVNGQNRPLTSVGDTWLVAGQLPWPQLR